MGAAVLEADAQALALRQRSVGPGMRPAKVQAGNMMPGAISTSLSTPTISHSRVTRPSGSVTSVP